MPEAGTVWCTVVISKGAGGRSPRPLVLLTKPERNRRLPWSRDLCQNSVSLEETQVYLRRWSHPWSVETSRWFVDLPCHAVSVRQECVPAAGQGQGPRDPGLQQTVLRTARGRSSAALGCLSPLPSLPTSGKMTRQCSEGEVTWPRART